MRFIGKYLKDLANSWRSGVCGIRPVGGGLLITLSRFGEGSMQTGLRGHSGLSPKWTEVDPEVDPKWTKWMSEVEVEVEVGEDRVIQWMRARLRS